MGTALISLDREHRKIEEAVSRGVALLNEVYPEWFGHLIEIELRHGFKEMHENLTEWGEPDVEEFGRYGLLPTGALLIDRELEFWWLLYEWERRAHQRMGAYQRLMKFYDRRKRRRRKAEKAARARELQKIFMKLEKKLHN